METPIPPSKPRVAKDFLAAVLDTVIDGVISINESGTMLSVNAAALRIFGYREAELLGHNVTMLMPEPHRSVHARYIQSFRNTGIAKVIGVGGRELTALRADGSEFPIELGVTETLLDGVSIFVGVIRDITERHTAQKLSSELAGIAEVVVDALVVIDERGTIQSWNPAASRIFGYQTSEVMGKNVKLLMPEPYHSEHDGYLRRFAVTREPRIIGSGREVTGRRKDGTLVPIDLAVSELRLDGAHRYVGLIRDISERKRREQEREQLIEALKLTNQELDDFAYIASHDLKEPLRGLANNANFLEEDYRERLDDAGKARIARMRYLCIRMESLINDLLYVSRLGRQELAIRDTDLNLVINEIVQLMEPVLEEQQASIVIPKRLPYYECDHVRVQELFRNLITNAVKYNTSSTKRVEVGFLNEYAGRKDVFYVKDNGVGIDPRFHSEVFRIFKRLNAEPDDTKGTGSGLTFVKKIVERHNGSVWIESQLGEGATFFFTLS
ncbi:MAG TPA: PAS domain S-box protein [Polyangiales bacterium]|nr:PAS domain S-box protein [Polyangiales bacterium]